jgi:type VI secretion system protein VasJ
MDLLSLGKEPISAENPTGTDVRYDPEFEDLQAEIDKLSSPTSSGSVDWKKIVKLSSGILEGKSKDLLVASYLAVGLIHTQHIEGLLAGTTIYGDLIESFWEKLFPPKKRLRGRIGAIEWWVEKSASVLEHMKLDPLPAEKTDQLKEQVGRVDQLLNEYLDEPPLLRGIQRYVEMIPSAAEKESEPEPEPQPEKQTKAADSPPPPQTRPKVEAVSKESESVASDGDAQKVFRLGVEHIRKAAAFLRDSNIGSPVPYRWTRFAAWASIVALPPATDGKTMIPPPAAQISADLKAFRDNGNWAALVKLAETSLLQSVFWLDLNRFSWEGLGNMGEQHLDAQEAVCQETTLLLNRLPGLITYSFSDGTPLADSETRAWIAGIGFASGAGTKSQELTVSGMPAGETDHLGEILEKAFALAKKKKTLEATQILQQGLQSSSSPREMLHFRMALSQVLTGMSKSGFVIPHLQEILTILETYRLEEWDRELAVRALKIAYAGFEADANEQSKRQAAEILSRIARLDPVEALRLAKK